MPKKSKQNESAGRRKRAYEMTDMINVKGVPQDPLRQIEADALQELADEYKTLKMEQMIEKRRQDVARLRDGTVDRGSMASNADFMKMARLISDLSPEEQQRVASAYAVLRMADRGQVGGSLGLLGPLLGYAKQNPGASEAQMVQYLTLMSNQFSKGIEIAKASNPKQDGSVELLKIFSDLVKDSVKKPMEDLAKNLQPQPSAFEQIIMNPEMRSAAKEMGMFGGREITKGGSTEMDLKIAEITTANTLELKKLDLEWRKSMLERQAEDRKTENLLAVFAPLATAFAGPVSQKMQAFGQQQAAAHMSPGIMPRGAPIQNPGDNPAMQSSVILVKCDCGYDGEVRFEGSAPASFKCPGCDRDLYMQDQGPTQNVSSTEPSSASGSGSLGRYDQPIS